MDNAELKLTEQNAEHEARADTAKAERLDWETPRMEDVSEQVMAQPYIRFT
jgi:hypothetical protein